MHFLQKIRNKHFWISVRYKIALMFAYNDLIRTRVIPIYKYRIRKYQQRYQINLRKIQQKETIEVAFLLVNIGMWKVDRLFQLMQADERFHPYIVICPYSIYKSFSQEECFKTIQRTESFIKDKGYEYIIPYDKENKKWLDIKKICNLDIVFFSTPYKDVHPNYYIYHFKDKLTCYVSYGFLVSNMFRAFYDLPMENLLWKYFVETSVHKEYSRIYSKSKGINTVVSGLPSCEEFIDKNYTSTDVWKKQSSIKKKIIWAPHHTIEDTMNYSTFLMYADLMLSLAVKYENYVQFAFKPHQLLKFKLIKLLGEEKVNEYYNTWGTLANTQLEEGGYTDLFLTSDAMIHDSGSFLVEYLYVNKPVMFLVKDENLKDRFNAFGTNAFSLHYHGNNQFDIEKFIQNVINGIDTMYDERKKFYDTYLYSQDDIMPSEKIMNYLYDTLTIEK